MISTAFAFGVMIYDHYECTTAFFEALRQQLRNGMHFLTQIQKYAVRAIFDDLCFDVWHLKGQKGKIWKQLMLVLKHKRHNMMMHFLPRFFFSSDFL